jgi:nickel transport protein
MTLDLFNSLHLKAGRFFWALFAFFLLIVFASPAYAHKVHIFAYVDGDVIKTESRFNGGRPARDCSVTVTGLKGQDVVASGHSDALGFFHFPVPAQGGGFDIAVTCGDGHRGSWRLEAEEYLPAGTEPVGHVHQQPQTTTLPHDNNEKALRKIIGEEVDKKLAPLRRDLARLAEKKTGLQDILGGIGYLLGLAGLAAYMQFKKRK